MWTDINSIQSAVSKTIIVSINSADSDSIESTIESTVIYSIASAFESADYESNMSANINPNLSAISHTFYDPFESAVITTIDSTDIKTV